MSDRLRASGECRDLALLTARFHGSIHRAKELRAETVIKLFQTADAWRRPERFEQILQACSSDARGRTGHENDAYPQADYLLMLLVAARAVDAGEIAKQHSDNQTIAEAINVARTNAVKKLIIKNENP
jgi:tRNA nucleotidyltransferase (CCA-adding enzyme)